LVIVPIVCFFREVGDNTKNMKKITELPPEILRRCFRSLAPPDLKSSVLVSEDWRAVGEDPSLWTWCQVTIRSREDLDKLSVRRLRKVQKISIKSRENLDANDWEAFLQAAVKLEEVDLYYFFKLSLEQITSIITTIAQEDTKLKKLILPVRNLLVQHVEHVEPEALARAVVKLEELDFQTNLLRPEQMTSIVTTIAQEDTKLKKLDLKGKNLSHVDPEALAKAAVKLEELDLQDTQLRAEQITSILTTIALNNTKLKKLNLRGMVWLIYLMLNQKL